MLRVLGAVVLVVLSCCWVVTTAVARVVVVVVVFVVAVVAVVRRGHFRTILTPADSLTRSLDWRHDGEMLSVRLAQGSLEAPRRVCGMVTKLSLIHI